MAARAGERAGQGGWGARTAEDGGAHTAGRSGHGDGLIFFSVFSLGVLGFFFGLALADSVSGGKGKAEKKPQNPKRKNRKKKKADAHGRTAQPRRHARPQATTAQRRNQRNALWPHSPPPAPPCPITTVTPPDYNRNAMITAVNSAERAPNALREARNGQLAP